MEKLRKRIYLASLLHDIGKFYQWADRGSTRDNPYLDEQFKNEATYGSLNTERYSHKHVLWTVRFIRDYHSAFANLSYEDSKIFSSDGSGLLDLAAGCHLQSDEISQWANLIKEADFLSSGMDCESTEALTDSDDKTNKTWDSFKRECMIPVLQTIDIHHQNDKGKTDCRYIPVDKLNLSRDFFPQSAYPSPNYAQLWDEFKNEFKLIKANSYVAFSETLLALLYKYTGCIPASTINSPDVSLYDHLKTTAAISICLFDYHHYVGNKEQSPFLLIGADFSGIQSYIYQIVSKYAGKNLKGRSFYLHLLSDAVVRYLLKELHLFQANVIYNSGGGFYLLAPNTPFHQQRLKKCVDTIESHLFQAHGTALYIAIDSIELSEDALMHRNGENLCKAWGDLFTKRDRKKMAKFADQIEANYGTYFEPNRQGGTTKRDSITGEEFTPSESVSKKEQLFLKPLTAMQIDLGEQLRETDLIVIKAGTPLEYWEHKTHISPADLGFTYYFLSEADLKAKRDLLYNEADKVIVLTLNGKNGNCDFLHAMDGINNIYGLEFYGGNELFSTHVTTFNEMCINGNFSRLGILRMDVDNLGQIFQKGLAPERATLSRLAALSRSFDFFFSGYLNTIWKETEPEKSFIIYSGGDDVFIVGSWETTISLAERIRKDFRDYTCDNPSFSLSGGIAIVPPKFPVMKGAEESAKEEQRAKGHVVSLPDKRQFEKNSISFMGMPLNWDYEYPQVKSLKETLVKLLEKNSLPKSFLSKLALHYANAGMKNHCITNMKIYWLLAYDLNRMKERSGFEEKKLIDTCIKEVCNKNTTTLNGIAIKTNYHALELWNFASRWAELDYRSKNETIDD